MDAGHDQSERKLLSAVATLTEEVSGLRHEVGDLKRTVNETKEIVEAWGAVKTLGKFVKWSAGIIAALALIVATIRVSLTHMLGRY